MQAIRSAGRLVTIPQLWERLKAESGGRAIIGRNKLYELVADGKIPSVELGKRIYVREDALSRLMEQAESFQ